MVRPSTVDSGMERRIDKTGYLYCQNVLDTQRSLLNRQDDHAASEGQVLQALIGLYRALGGGWDPAAWPEAPADEGEGES